MLMPAHTGSGGHSPALMLKTVLVVEDDEDLGLLIMEILQEEGKRHQPVVRAILVADSLQALELVSAITPNLLLLDYYLPRMNGLDLYDRLHAMEGLEQVPAIFMSANPPLKEIEKRHLISVRKPFNLDELWNIMNKLLA